MSKEAVPDFFTAFIKEKSPAFFAVVALFSGCLLYLPKSIKVQLGLNLFLIEYNVWIGAAFLFSVVYLTVSFVFFIGMLVKKQVAKQRRKSRLELTRKSYMEKLTYTEILYLVPYLTGLNSLYLRQDDGVRGSLEAKDILYQAASVGSLLSGFAYNIQPWALEYLEANPDTFERHVGKLETERDIEYLYRNGRPWERNSW